MLESIKADTALNLSARLCCVWVLLQSLELVTLWRELRDEHLLGWQRFQRNTGFFRRSWERVQRFPVNLAVVAWRIGAAAGCFFLAPCESPVGWALVCTLFVAQLYVHRCIRTFFSNADNIILICLGAISVGALPGGSGALRGLSLGFVAFQVSLAYFMSGWDKLAKAHWRDGSWLTKVFCDSSHRFLPFGLWLRDHPRAALWLAQGVIWLELLFPLCLALPPTGFWAFILGGLVFHGAVMVFMALPGFFWAFAATYPALYFAHGWIAQHIHF